MAMQLSPQGFPVVQVRQHVRGGVGVVVPAALAVTIVLAVADSVSFVAVTVTRNVPALVNVWVGSAHSTTSLPSPKSQVKTVFSRVLAGVKVIESGICPVLTLGRTETGP